MVSLRIWLCSRSAWAHFVIPRPPRTPPQFHGLVAIHRRMEYIPYMTSLDLDLWQLLRDAGPLHGLDIMQRAEGDLGKRVLPGTLYKTLHRLERNGFISGFWEDDRTENPHRGPRRRYYRVTGATPFPLLLVTNADRTERRRRLGSVGGRRLVSSGNQSATR